MNIAVWHNLPSGGGKRALFHHVKGLIKRGHYVESWCPPSADQTYLPLSMIIKENVVPLDWKDQETNSLLGKIINPIKRGSKFRKIDKHCKECAGQINSRGFDLLLANSCMYFGTSPIGKYVNTNKILYLQEPYRVLYEFNPIIPWPAVCPPENILRFPHFIKLLIKDSLKINHYRNHVRKEINNARAFDIILVNSYFSRENIIRSYGLDAKVCYLGIDTDTFVNAYKPKENNIVTIGALFPGKRIKFIIEAMSHLSLPRPSLVCVCNAIDEIYLGEVQKCAKNNGVNLLIKYRISDAELVDTLQRSMLLAYAPQLEPFGYAPLEANACGLPVVAVSEGGVRETVINNINGLLVDNDPREMAKAISLLLTEKGKAEQLGLNGMKLVKRQWSMETAMDNLEKYISLFPEGR